MVVIKPGSWQQQVVIPVTLLIYSKLEMNKEFRRVLMSVGITLHADLVSIVLL